MKKPCLMCGYWSDDMRSHFEQSPACFRPQDHPELIGRRADRLCLLVEYRPSQKVGFVFTTGYRFGVHGVELLSASHYTDLAGDLVETDALVIQRLVPSFHVLVPSSGQTGSVVANEEFIGLISPDGVMYPCEGCNLLVLIDSLIAEGVTLHNWLYVSTVLRIFLG